MQVSIASSMAYVLDRAVLKEDGERTTLWLVPTIKVTHPGGSEYFTSASARPSGISNVASSVGNMGLNRTRARFRKGVKIACGTDQMPFELQRRYDFLDGAWKRKAYVEAGMTPSQALCSCDH